jgi:exodeoxyribonuclease VII large subunit
MSRDQSFIFTVRQLTGYLKTLLARDRALRDLWVRGEVADCSRPASGHCYFTLKDESAQLRCVMWREVAAALDFELEDGLRVLARGAISVYERAGQYQLIVSELKAEGLGALYLAFEQLKRKLQAEGLFDPARKRPLPRFPRRIALITSPEGAVLSDLVSILRRRWPAADLLLLPTPVQGAAAVEGIVKALGRLSRLPGLDLAILARGGGSLEDLAAFNAEAVARAIAASPIPVVSAVGHETDFTIADFVADQRAPTPSAAAELVAPDRRELSRRLAALRTRAGSALRGWLASRRRELALLRARPVLRAPLTLLSERRQGLDELVRHLLAAIRRKPPEERRRLDSLGGRLRSLNPFAVLERGYVLVRKDDGSLARRACRLAREEEIVALFWDGEARMRVKGIQAGATRGGPGGAVSPGPGSSRLPHADCKEEMQE